MANKNTSPQSWRRSTPIEPSGGFTNKAFSWSRGHGRSQPRAPGVPVPEDKLPPEVNLMDGLERTPLRTISVPTVEPDEDDIRVKDFSYAGSYNWLNSDTPTILVPGAVPSSLPSRE